MNFFRQIFVFLLTVVTFNCLYNPQPILPILAEIYGVSMQVVSPMVTVTMLLLGTAPVFGILIEKISPRSMLMVFVLLLAISQFMFVLVDNAYLQILVRACQGLIFPAIFTALMTYISQTSREKNTSRNMHLYIICTVIGGFSGRYFSGFFTTMFDWKFYIIVSGILLCAFFPGIFLLQRHTNIQKVHFKLRDMLPVMKDPLKMRLYLIIFLGFFSFSAIMNYVPFRIRELNPQSSALMIGQIYFGYLGGLFSVVFLAKIQTLIQLEKNQILIFILGTMPALVGMLLHDYAVIMFVMFCFTSLFFLNHSCISGYINRISINRKATVNGLYVGFYYLGGSLGSYLPGFVYKYTNWNTFILLLLGIIIAQFLLCLNARRHFVH